jgi:exonuclease SbcD
MRIIHTADWHLGRILHNVSLLEDQQHILEQLKSEIERNPPGALIIAGDIYDKAIPSEGAVHLLESFINYVGGNLAVPIIMISGNHDSGPRLSFASKLLEKAKVHIIGKASVEIQSITLSDKYGEVIFYPLPYLSPIAARSLYQDSEILTHQDVIQRQVAHITEQHPKGKRSVLIIHEFVIGGEVSDSERQLSVGGTSHIEANILSQFDYVAMGHLHQAQRTGYDHVRYSGSLLKYSFSEVKHNKGITEVTLDDHGFVSSLHTPLKPTRDMRIVKGTLIEILEQAHLDTQREDFIRAELEDKEGLHEPMRRLKEIYPNALEIKYLSKTNQNAAQTETSFQELQKQDISELFAEFYQHICAEELNEEQHKLVADVVEQITSDSH